MTSEFGNELLDFTQKKQQQNFHANAMEVY